MTAPTQAEVLLPCPFCGGTNQSIHDGTDRSPREPSGFSFVICECDADGPYRPSVNEAIAAWNRRTASIEQAEPLTWESTTSAYIKFITDSRYNKFAPAVQKYYKPICTKSHVGNAGGVAQEPYCWHIDSINSAEWCFAKTREGVLDNAKLVDPSCIMEKPMPLYAAPQAAVPDGYKPVPIEPTKEIIAAAAIAAWPVASAADIELARKAAPIVLMTMDLGPTATVESLTMIMATMAPAYRAMIAAAPSPQDTKEQG